MKNGEMSMGARGLCGISAGVLIGIVLECCSPTNLNPDTQGQKLDQPISSQVDTGIKNLADAGQAETIQQNLQSQVNATVPSVDK